MKESNGILNSKGIYDRCSLPRLTVKFKDREMKNLEEEIEKVKSKKKKREGQNLESNNTEEKKEEPPLKKTKIAQNRNENEEVGRPPPKRKFRKVRKRKVMAEKEEKTEKSKDTTPLEVGKQPELEKKKSPGKVKVQTIIEIFNQMNRKEVKESNCQTSFLTPRKKTFSKVKKNDNPISPASKMVFKSKSKAQPSPSLAHCSSLSQRRFNQKRSTTQLSSKSHPPKNNFKSIRSYFQNIQQTAVVITPRNESESSSLEVLKQNSPITSSSLIKVKEKP